MRYHDLKLISGLFSQIRRLGVDGHGFSEKRPGVHHEFKQRKQAMILEQLKEGDFPVRYVSLPEGMSQPFLGPTAYRC